MKLTANRFLAQNGPAAYWLLGAAAAAILAGCGGGGGGSSIAPPPPPSSPTPIPAGTPIALSGGMTLGQPVFSNGDTSSGGQGSPVGGIPCDNMSVTYHVHAHLSLFNNGQRIAIPGAVGINNFTQTSPGVFYATSSGCYYYLHTHDASGILHIEWPASSASPTLGQLFDIWGQPLTLTNVSGYQGSVTVFLDGAQYTGDPRVIMLTSHRDINLEVGSPLAIPPQLTWPSYYTP